MRVRIDRDDVLSEENQRRRRGFEGQQRGRARRLRFWKESRTDDHFEISDGGVELLFGSLGELPFKESPGFLLRRKGKEKEDGKAGEGGSALELFRFWPLASFEKEAMNDDDRLT